MPGPQGAGGGISIGDVYSDVNDLSDVTIHRQLKSGGSTVEYTLLNVTDGPKDVIGGVAVGWTSRSSTDTTPQTIGDITVDGNVISSFPENTSSFAEYQNNNGSKSMMLLVPPLHYDSSLKVKWEYNATGDELLHYWYVLGSGPHTAAIVTDGDPVYSTHMNVSDAQIDDLIPPDGYKVVKNPDISHRDPMNRGAWDDAAETVTDHPYWAEWHDALENIRITANQFGPREMLKNVDTPADRGAIPFSTPDPANGNAVPDPSDTSNIKADAMAFQKAQWDERLPASI